MSDDPKPEKRPDKQDPIDSWIIDLGAGGTIDVVALIQQNEDRSVVTVIVNDNEDWGTPN